MSTKTRPELSKKNRYYVEKHRYYELKHFCLQYPIWKKAYVSLDGLSKRPDDLMMISTNCKGSPTERCAIARERYAQRMRMVEQACQEVDGILSSYILIGVTNGFSYNTLLTKYNIPCCKDTYYNMYRKFFWVLNQLRE